MSDGYYYEGGFFFRSPTFSYPESATTEKCLPFNRCFEKIPEKSRDTELGYPGGI
jgi:hypothetical protein